MPSLSKPMRPIIVPMTMFKSKMAPVTAVKSWLLMTAMTACSYFRSTKQTCQLKTNLHSVLASILVQKIRTLKCLKYRPQICTCSYEVRDGSSTKSEISRKSELFESKTSFGYYILHILGTACVSSFFCVRFFFSAKITI